MYFSYPSKFLVYANVRQLFVFYIIWKFKKCYKMEKWVKYVLNNRFRGGKYKLTWVRRNQKDSWKCHNWGLLRAERPNPFPRASRRRAHKIKKTQRHKVHRERLRLFMRKGGWISIRKWKMIHRLQFISR